MTGRFSFLRRFGRDVAGSAAVETVLIMPLAILVMVAAMEAGNYLYSEHQVVKGVRDAARFAGRVLPLSTCASASAEADLPSTDPAWQTIANVAVYGSTANTGPRRLWTWNANGTDVVIRYACVAQTGLYTSTGFAPQIAVIGKPTYPSLFGTMTGLTSSYRLYSRQQAAGVGI